MTEPAYQEVTLAEVLDVACNEAVPFTGEGDAKLLGFMLREGECTVDISKPTIRVWYSWLPRANPSRYDFRLAPGIVRRLMGLGGVKKVVDEATFQVGPGTTGTGRYVFDIPQKWVRINCDEERIIICVRDEQKDLGSSAPEHYGKIVRCKQCNGILRTALAKQCFDCGYDWH